MMMFQVSHVNVAIRQFRICIELINHGIESSASETESSSAFTAIRPSY
jgi:hypothetical protein